MEWYYWVIGLVLLIIVFIALATSKNYRSKEKNEYEKFRDKANRKELPDTLSKNVTDEALETPGVLTRTIPAIISSIVVLVVGINVMGGISEVLYEDVQNSTGILSKLDGTYTNLTGIFFVLCIVFFIGLIVFNKKW